MIMKVGGTLNLEGMLIVRITGVGEDTALQQIVNMVQQAQVKNHISATHIRRSRDVSSTELMRFVECVQCTRCLYISSLLLQYCASLLQSTTSHKNMLIEIREKSIKSENKPRYINEGIGLKIIKWTICDI